MKNKLVSFMSGVLVGVIGMYGYFTFFGIDKNDIPGKNGPKEISGDITDEQLQKISDRSGLSKEVIQERLDSGENMRDIMGGGGKGNK